MPATLPSIPPVTTFENVGKHTVAAMSIESIAFVLDNVLRGVEYTFVSWAGGFVFVLCLTLFLHAIIRGVSMGATGVNSHV